MKLLSLFLSCQLASAAGLHSITIADPLSQRSLRRWGDAAGEEGRKTVERLEASREDLAAAKDAALEAKKALPPSTLKIVEQMEANKEAAQAIKADAEAIKTDAEATKTDGLPPQEVIQHLPAMSKTSAKASITHASQNKVSWGKGSKPVRLPYRPAPPSESCDPMIVDLGPNPDGSILQNLGVHMQVALEQTCINEYLGCAYDSGDYSFIAEAYGGLFEKSTDKATKFKDVLAKGLADLKTTGFGKSGRTNGHKRRCPQNFAQDRSKYIGQLQTAWRQHFDGYGVTPGQVWRALVNTKFDGFVALCDQIGDDMTGSYAMRLGRFVRERGQW